MNGWLEETLDRVAERVVCGYDRRQSPASEPTALAALALALHDRRDEAAPGLARLAEIQADDGSVGVRADEPQPIWPTTLAILAWRAGNAAGYRDHLDRAVDALLSVKGKTLPRTPDVGHNTMLIAWPWVEGTHSWVEPTALAVLALKAMGQGGHARIREAVRLLVDRQIPGGGCNYGNTFCLGQKLRPHVMPTGLALTALAGEKLGGNRVTRSVAWLRRTLSSETASPSLCWGLIGLAAHDAAPQEASIWLEHASRRVLQNDRSPYKLALIALAAAEAKLTASWDYRGDEKKDEGQRTKDE